MYTSVATSGNINWTLIYHSPTIEKIVFTSGLEAFTTVCLVHSCTLVAKFTLSVENTLAGEVLQ